MNLQVVFLIKFNLEESKEIRLNGKETKQNYFETKERNTQTRKQGRVIPEKKTPKEITCKCKYKCLNKIADNKISEIFQS